MSVPWEKWKLGPLRKCRSTNKDVGRAMNGSALAEEAGFLVRSRERQGKGVSAGEYRPRSRETTKWTKIQSSSASVLFLDTELTLSIAKRHGCKTLGSIPCITHRHTERRERQNEKENDAIGLQMHYGFSCDSKRTFHDNVAGITLSPATCGLPPCSHWFYLCLS